MSEHPRCTNCGEIIEWLGDRWHHVSVGQTYRWCVGSQTFAEPVEEVEYVDVPLSSEAKHKLRVDRIKLNDALREAEDTWVRAQTSALSLRMAIAVYDEMLGDT